MITETGVVKFYLAAATKVIYMCTDCVRKQHGQDKADQVMSWVACVLDCGNNCWTREQSTYNDAKTCTAYHLHMQFATSFGMLPCEPHLKESF